MDGTELVIITFISCGMVVAILGIIAWTIVTLVNGRRQPRAASDNESKILQEMHHGLSKMEQRIETLETLLLEREKRG